MGERSWEWVVMVLVLLSSLQLAFGCLEEEKIALLQLKPFFDVQRLGWGENRSSYDCCQWERVTCNITTGRIIELQLRFLNSYKSYNSGYMNVSLFTSFEQLQNLDLSGNNIVVFLDYQDDLPKFKNLEFLDLSENKLDSNIFSFLGNLTSLKYLGLSNVGLEKTDPIKGISNLKNLESLDLSGNNLDNNIFSSLTDLTSLKYLYLSNIGSNNDNGAVSIQGLQYLIYLEELFLMDSFIQFDCLQCLETLTLLKELRMINCTFADYALAAQDKLSLKALEYLDVRDSKNLNINFLQSINKMTSLKFLSLHSCGLTNNMLSVEGLCELVDLQTLNIAVNNLSGIVPACFTNLTSLERLYISFNHFKIPISMEPFLNLSKFKYFDGLYNHIDAKIEYCHSSAPEFQLTYLNLQGCTNLKTFPKFLYYQHDLQVVDFSSNTLTGKFPTWLLENNTLLQYLNLAYNFLSGPFHLPSFSFENKSNLDISLDFFNNSFSLSFLNISNNHFSGMIPRSLGNLLHMNELIMSNNLFEGPIPRELCKLDLQILDISRNKFYGRLPSCFLTSNIVEVYLSRNRLQGTLGDAFSNKSRLTTLDMSHNNISGVIPQWIERLTSLNYLILNNNNLEGQIPIQLCKLEQLSLINLSHNRFSGLLPCLNITTLDGASSYIILPPSLPIIDKEPIEFSTKNMTYSYERRILSYMSGIDLSCNNLIGVIPHEYGSLSEIRVLNLSHNNLIGPIPSTFSRLKQLESLDLSYNNLNGTIPPQLIEMNALSFFKVGHNNLSGKTPERKAQFGTFDESCYSGNPFLCGDPLPKCSHERGSITPGIPIKSEEDDGFLDMNIFYVSFSVTYVIILLGFVGALCINPYWRRRWFYVVEECMTTCYYFVVDHF